MNKSDLDRYTRDWIDVEKWLVMNTQVEPQRWFRALQIARDLNLDENYVDGFLDTHFQTGALERLSDGNSYTYRNFQYRYKVKSGLKNAHLKISVDAPQYELYTAVHQVINTLTAHGWDYISVEPIDYNDRDQEINHVDLVLMWKTT